MTSRDGGSSSAGEAACAAGASGAGVDTFTKAGGGTCAKGGQVD